MSGTNGQTVTERILPLVDKIPAFSQSVTRVLQLASNINCPPKELVDVVSSDPVLTLKVLRMVNSAYFGLSSKVSSIHQALVTLGLNTLKNTALSLAMLGALPRENAAGLDMDSLWLHSLAVGLSGRRLALAKGLSRADAEDHFITGLLHDVGKLVLARFEPEGFHRAMEAAVLDERDLVLAEEKVIGVTHAAVGAVLAERWGLPEPLARCLAHHHDPDADPDPLTDLIYVADQSVKRLKLGFSANPITQAPSEALRARLGLDGKTAASALSGLAEELGQARIMLEL